MYNPFNKIDHSNNTVLNNVVTNNSIIDSKEIFDLIFKLSKEGDKPKLNAIKHLLTKNIQNEHVEILVDKICKLKTNPVFNTPIHQLLHYLFDQASAKAASSIDINTLWTTLTKQKINVMDTLCKLNYMSEKVAKKVLSIKAANKTYEVKTVVDAKTLLLLIKYKWINNNIIKQYDTNTNNIIKQYDNIIYNVYNTNDIKYIMPNKQYNIDININIMISNISNIYEIYDNILFHINNTNILYDKINNDILKSMTNDIDNNMFNSIVLLLIKYYSINDINNMCNNINNDVLYNVNDNVYNMIVSNNLITSNIINIIKLSYDQYKIYITNNTFSDNTNNTLYDNILYKSYYDNYNIFELYDKYNINVINSNIDINVIYKSICNSIDYIIENINNNINTIVLDILGSICDNICNNMIDDYILIVLLYNTNKYNTMYNICNTTKYNTLYDGISNGNIIVYIKYSHILYSYSHILDILDSNTNNTLYNTDITTYINYNSMLVSISDIDILVRYKIDMINIQIYKYDIIKHMYNSKYDSNVYSNNVYVNILHSKYNNSIININISDIHDIDIYNIFNVMVNDRILHLYLCDSNISSNIINSNDIRIISILYIKYINDNVHNSNIHNIYYDYIIYNSIIDSNDIIYNYHYNICNTSNISSINVINDDILYIYDILCNICNTNSDILYHIKYMLYMSKILLYIDIDDKQIEYIIEYNNINNNICNKYIIYNINNYSNVLYDNVCKIISNNIPCNKYKLLDVLIRNNIIVLYNYMVRDISMISNKSINILIDNIIDNTNINNSNANICNNTVILNVIDVLVNNNILYAEYNTDILYYTHMIINDSNMYNTYIRHNRIYSYNRLISEIAKIINKLLIDNYAFINTNSLKSNTDTTYEFILSFIPSFNYQWLTVLVPALIFVRDIKLNAFIEDNTDKNIFDSYANICTYNELIDMLYVFPRTYKRILCINKDLLHNKYKIHNYIFNSKLNNSNICNTNKFNNNNLNTNVCNKITHYINNNIMPNDSKRSIISSSECISFKYTYEVDSVTDCLTVAIPLDIGKSPYVVEKVDKTDKNVKNISNALNILLRKTYMVHEIFNTWKCNIDRRVEGHSECLICFFVLEPDHMTLPDFRCDKCSSHFHMECIHKWIKQSKSEQCPMCRNDFKIFGEYGTM